MRPATSTPDSLLNVLVVHSEGEPCDEHGRTPLVGQVLAKQLKTDEDLTILLTAIAKHTSTYHQFFDAHLFPLIRAAAERPNSTAA